MRSRLVCLCENVHKRFNSYQVGWFLSSCLIRMSSLRDWVLRRSMRIVNVFISHCILIHLRITHLNVINVWIRRLRLKRVCAGNNKNSSFVNLRRKPLGYKLICPTSKRRCIQKVSRLKQFALFTLRQTTVWYEHSPKAKTHIPIRMSMS